MAIASFGLHKEYPGGGGLHGVDLEVPEGAVYGLVGPNGSGKTTLLSLLAGLRHPDAGEIRFSVSRDRVALCPDVPEFEPWMTAHEVVELARSLSDPTLDRRLVDSVLEETGLTDVAGRRVGAFSRGMTQRLALAATLIGDPAVVILDEPSSALDPIGRVEVLDLVARLGHQRTVLFSSHILADVQRVCDVVGVLIEGRLRYQGSISQLLAEHLQPAWNVRVRGDAVPISAALSAEVWVQRATLGVNGEIRVAATSLDAGEKHLVGALARSGAHVIAIEPAVDDLEDVFLQLTTGFDCETPPPETPGAPNDVDVTR